MEYVKKQINPSSNETCIGLSEIVKNMKKPKHEVKRFSGNPIDFPKFIRQFKSRIVSNTDTSEERMTYLEELTTGEANKVVCGFSHFPSEKAYQAAMDQLSDRYGDNEVIASTYIKKALEWPTIRPGEPKALDEYALFLVECMNAAEHVNASKILEYPEHLKRLMFKLPVYLHDRWRNIALNLKENKKPVLFRDFVKFVQKEAKKVNDPIFGAVGRTPTGMETPRMEVKPKRTTVTVRQTTVESGVNGEVVFMCPIHQGSHPFIKCRTFLSKSDAERKQFIKKHKVCFRCLASTTHFARECKAEIKCGVCSSPRHLGVMHIHNREQQTTQNPAQANTTATTKPVTSNCMEICRDGVGRSCAKICLATVYMAKNPNKRAKVYILIDDQSNKSLADTRIFDVLGVSGEWSNYTMKTCNGERETKGRNLSGLIVESLDGATKIEAPSLLECAEIPGNMSEIATPEVAMAFPHLKSIAGQIPPLNKGSDVLLLPTTLQPCPNTFQIHTLFDDKDDFLSLSVEERKFLEIMEKEGGLRDGKWTAPLPFKKLRERLPNIREQAWSRAQIPRKNMDRNPLKKQHMLDFMDGVINKGHAEVASPLKNDEELPGCYLQEWKSWKNDLKELQNVSVPTYLW
ncbi:uncharacterized protein LOC117103452 [Anneissia japonica]|uniref:uncharacterized protein LOC117103452 n=1 Tax=Anneissia japonica TaxID=1529436 RepID=UPI001425A88D|nr:uncharacterized protein LOC117103452 [Anneissia japonica]